MRKTFFMRTFNLNIRLVILTLLTGFLGWLLKFLAINLELSLPISLDLSIVNTYLNLGSKYTYLTMSFLLAILFLSVAFEILNRVRFDSLVNYFKSIYHTFKFRRFLTQYEKSEKVTTIENQSITTYNPVNEKFNRAVRKSAVDIRKDEITVYVRVPKDNQAVNILKEMEDLLKEEVSSQHPDYYFSSPNRVKNNLWLVGKKR